MAREFLITHRDTVWTAYWMLQGVVFIVLVWCAGADYGYRHRRDQ